MSVQLREVGVTADLTVDVPRDAGGDLPAGVRTVLARVEAVEAVEAVDVTGLTPRLNDVRTDVTAELRVTAEPEAASVREALDDGFGVQAEAVDVDADHPSP